MDEILIENFEGSLNGCVVKTYLYRDGLKQPICELCGQDENWNGGKNVTYIGSYKWK